MISLIKIMDEDDTNATSQAKCYLHHLKHAVRGIGPYVSSDKTDFICFKSDGAFSTLNEISRIFDVLLYHYLIKYCYKALILIGKCPWCNGYRRRQWTRQHEFKSWTTWIAFHIALIPLGKVRIQLFSLQLWVNSRAD